MHKEYVKKIEGVYRVGDTRVSADTNVPWRAEKP